MPDSSVGQGGRRGSRAGLRRGVMIGCSVWETPDRHWRFIKPLHLDNGLQYRWLVHERDSIGVYFCHDDDFATLAEARESVGT